MDTTRYLTTANGEPEAQGGESPAQVRWTWKWRLSARPGSRTPALPLWISLWLALPQLCYKNAESPATGIIVDVSLSLHHYVLKLYRFSHQPNSRKCFLLVSVSAHSLQVSTRVWRKEAESTCSPAKKAEVQRGKQDERPVSTHYGVRGRQAWQVCKWHGAFEQGISHGFWFSLALTF